jgi:N-acetylmuramoyl-L-alanine amidase
LKKLPFYAGLAIVFCVIIAPAQGSRRSDLKAYDSVSKKRLSQFQTIILDPGHGGKDTGAIGPTKVLEKDVTLAVAKRLRDILQERGFQVLMTRDTDRTLSLDERARIVNSNEADFFISIHANAAKNERARGFETFYLSDPFNDSYESQKTADDSYRRYDLFGGEESDLGQVYLQLLDQVSSEDRALSIQFAEMVHDAMKQKLKAPDRGVKRARFFVLKRTNIPAVLIEVGFVSNTQEETLLRSAEHQDTIAQAIADGISLFRQGQDLAPQLVKK